MKKEIKILGYYKREKDNTEYVLYEVGGEKYLTNGVLKWRQIEKFIPKLVPVKKIDIGEILVKLKNHMPFLKIVELLEAVEKQRAKKPIDR